MPDQPRPDPARERWAPVGAVFPIFINLVRVSWRELLVIWALITAAVLAITAAANALPLPTTAILGLTPAIFPVSFGIAMAAHRMLWPNAPNLAECADVATKAFLTVLAVVAIRQVLMSLGFGFLVFPGIAVAVFLLLAPIIVMAEGPGVRTAIERSARLIWPIGWAVFALLFLSAMSGLLLLVPLAMLAVPLSALGQDTLQAIIEAGASVAFPLSFTAMGVAVYLYVTGAGETRH